jgi:hypothetical protein
MKTISRATDLKKHLLSHLGLLAKKMSPEERQTAIAEQCPLVWEWLSDTKNRAVVACAVCQEIQHTYYNQEGRYVINKITDNEDGTKTIEPQYMTNDFYEKHKDHKECKDAFESVRWLFDENAKAPVKERAPRQPRAHDDAENSLLKSEIRDMQKTLLKTNEKMLQKDEELEETQKEYHTLEERVFEMNDAFERLEERCRKFERLVDLLGARGLAKQIETIWGTL